VTDAPDRSPAEMHVRTYRPSDEAAVIDLWTRCGLVVPHNNPRADIARKLSASPELFFVGTFQTEIVATVMAGYDGHRGWLNYLAVSPGFQRRGYGRQLVAHAEAALLQRGCPKVNLQIRAANERAAAFYARLGFARDEVLSMGKRLIHD
jgi:ribosomal protein S18 acetylase RimI-like enzyme